LEGGDTVGVECRTVDVIIDKELREFISEDVNIKMTTKNVAEANLTSISTSLDRVEDIFVEGELRDKSLRGRGDSEDSDLMVQEKRTNSKVNFIARRSLDPEVVTSSGESAVVDDNGVISIKGTVDGTGSKRRNVSGRDITVADAIIVAITYVLIIEDALVIGQERVEGEGAIRAGSVGKNLELKVTIDAEARRNIKK